MRRIYASPDQKQYWFKILPAINIMFFGKKQKLYR